MHTTTGLDRWRHQHSFGQEHATSSERKTLWVALLTVVFMVVEVTAGLTYGSMALLADGLHMGSHAMAMGIAVAAYVYARRHARDDRFSFGTGKVNALGGFSGALLLAMFAMLMAWGSVARFLNPVEIAFDQAIAVAVLGLLVNGVSVAVLGFRHHDDDGSEHQDHGHTHRDHNLRSAYFHVLADALTSFTAIFALLAGKYFDQVWLDPAMGIVGSLLVARWSWGLIRESSRVLLDHQAPSDLRDRIRTVIESGCDDRVADLHVWSIGMGVRAACLTLVSHEPKTPDDYKALIANEFHLDHTTVEIHRCLEGESAG